MIAKGRIALIFRTALLLTALGCVFPQCRSFAENSGSLTGTWAASGKRQHLDFLGDRKVFTYRLEGHVNLRKDLGESGDYWAECIGLWDSETGGSARCVWKDLNGGDRAFLALEGKIFEKGAAVTGEFVGGAGGLEGLEGTISFSWWSVSFSGDEGVIAGFAKDLDGQWRIP